MNLKELEEKVKAIIKKLINHGEFPKENNNIDYKTELNIANQKSNFETFLMNFAKDIISFSNSDGGIILIGIEENKATGKHDDIGLDDRNINFLEAVDLNDITQQFEKITKVGVSIDLQKFNISTRYFYYLIIEKSDQVLLPIKDFPQFKLYKGAIYYRASGKNEHANYSTPTFNRFLSIKANERSKEFMDIWSKLLPEMVDINPREVLILNPDEEKVYCFNGKENKLSGGDVEIEKDEDGVFKIILRTLSAGEIGKLVTDEGKPLYKIVGKIRQDNRDRVSLSSLEREVKKKANYKFTSEQLKICLHHLQWVSDPKFKVINPPKGTVLDEFKKFVYVGNVDTVRQEKKVLFSKLAVDEVVPIINNHSLHLPLFGKELTQKE